MYNTQPCQDAIALLQFVLILHTNNTNLPINKFNKITTQLTEAIELIKEVQKTYTHIGVSTTAKHAIN